MKKTIYYYNRKYPEYSITEIPVNDEEFLVRSDWKSLSGILVDYDICCGKPCDVEHFISLYTPYEDEEIHVHDTTLGNELIFSYNKKLITQWREDDIEHTIHKLEKRLNRLKNGCEE